MHIIFLNPQGNFDQDDSHMTEHPDFGGQLIYVKEVCMALAGMGHEVDIVTRRIRDPGWPEFADDIGYYEGYEKGLRIVRIPFGGDGFLRKELLWEHLDEFTDRTIAFYGDSPPDFATAHYADGGYSGVLLRKKAGLGFTFTGHSLGAQKLDKLGMNPSNYDEMESQYFFSKRITAERLSMTYAHTIITSTAQERFGQYSHPLYRGAVDPEDNRKFEVIPPGVNTRIFTTREVPGDRKVFDYLLEATDGRGEPFIVVSSRLDEKKNHRGVVEAFARTRALNEKARLAIVVRGVDDPYRDISGLPPAEREILGHIVGVIKESGLEDRVFFLDIRSQKALAATYRYFARQGSVFALTAFYEPFGLAPIEAAACGLPAVVTKLGGPSEIFKGGKGELVDPYDSDDIARGLLKGMEEHDRYAEEQEALVKARYTWARTAEAYYHVIEKGAGAAGSGDVEIPPLDDSERIKDYLARK
jgi:sucrose-phosphate synthase